MIHKIKVVILFGGRSGEHEISVHSAGSVINALNKEKYEVTTVYITREGRWLAGLDPFKVIAGETDGAIPVTILTDPTRRGFIRVQEDKMEVQEIDVVIPVLHGTYGEDGTVQGLLEMAGIPYVGAGVLGSALAMDKVLMKTVFAQHNLPHARFWSCLRQDWEQNSAGVIREVEKHFAYPCFVKPANLGSSVGISKAHNREELIRALNLAAKYDRKIILEESINAREVEVSVLGNDHPVASIPGEIIPLKEFYDYEAKYVDGFSKLIIPADLPEGTRKLVQELAVKAFKALDCAGMGRVDFFIDRENGKVLINEINTIPGFTRFSMYPKLWEASGISYSELLDRLIALAFERHQEKNRLLRTI